VLIGNAALIPGDAMQFKVVKIVLLASLYFWSMAASAQSIDEMYADIPSERLGMPKALDAAAKKKEIAVLDVKNGYISLRGDNLELAKFAKKTGGALLAVADTSYADARVMPKTLTFFEKTGNTWEDVTARYLPVIPDLVIDAFARQKCDVAISSSASGIFRYRLPRKGRTIRAIAESDALKKPCRGDLFHLEFEERTIGPINEFYLTLKFVQNPPIQ